jgi:hypothetical protein
VSGRLASDAAELPALRDGVRLLESEIRSGLAAGAGDGSSISAQLKRLATGADLQRLAADVTSLRGDTEAAPRRDEFAELKASVSKLFAGGVHFQTFAPQSAHLVGGIIGHLTQLHGRRVCDGSPPCVRVFASTVWDSCADHAATNAVDLSEKSGRFLSENQANQWITFDFTENQSVRPTAYALRSTEDCGAGCCQP